MYKNITIRSTIGTLFFSCMLFLGLVSFTPLSAQGAGLVPCGGYTTEGEAEESCNFTFFMEMLNGIISFLLFDLAMPLAALMFAYAGFLYLTSGVKPEQREKAKKLIGNIITGLVLALAAWLIVHTILTSLGVNPESIFLSNPTT
ncbi:MAG: hypothetical protein KBB88_03730 [Candidatus Pacebacteria bacterium]|nr:hypothetical protein [Candidatus Paceibacterota bacterium]